MKSLITTIISLTLPLFMLAQNVAKIGDKEYPTIEEAFNNATDGATITLISDAELSTPVTISNKSITLYLDKYNITSHSCSGSVLITMQDNSTLTIDGEGCISYDGTKECTIINVRSGSTLNLNSCTISSSKTWQGTICTFANFNMSSGTIANHYKSKDSSIQDLKSVALYLYGGHTSITNGQLTSNNTAIFNATLKNTTPDIRISDDVNIEGYVFTKNPNKFSSIPKSCLIFSTSTTTSNDNNYIYNIANIYAKETCNNLVLNDNIKYASPIEFVAKNASYTRVMSNAWGTLCVPFAIDINNSDVECYGITSVSDNTLVLAAYTESVPAGTPIVIKKKDASNSNINIIGVGNSTTVISPLKPTTSDANMFGAFAKTTIINSEEESRYFIAENKFYIAARETTIPPYRSYFTLSNHNPLSPSWMPSKTFSIVTSDDELTANTDIKATIPSLDDIKTIYNTQGQLLHSLQKGINLVTFKNGMTKKIIIK